MQPVDQQSLNWFFPFNWEFYHPTRPVVTIDVIQNTIMYFRIWFTALPIWLFVICGQLLVLYYDRIIFNLKSLLDSSMVNNTNTKKIDSLIVVQQALEILEPLKRLSSAIDLLHRRLSNMLLVNCFHSTIFMLSCSYFFIEYSVKKLIMATCWTSFLVIEHFFLFCLVCYAADGLQGAVSIVV